MMRTALATWTRAALVAAVLTGCELDFSLLADAGKTYQNDIVGTANAPYSEADLEIFLLLDAYPSAFAAALLPLTLNAAEAEGWFKPTMYPLQDDGDCVAGNDVSDELGAKIEADFAACAQQDGVIATTFFTSGRRFNYVVDFRSYVDRAAGLQIDGSLRWSLVVGSAAVEIETTQSLLFTVFPDTATGADELIEATGDFAYILNRDTGVLTINGSSEYVNPGFLAVLAYDALGIDPNCAVGPNAGILTLTGGSREPLKLQLVGCGGGNLARGGAAAEPWVEADVDAFFGSLMPGFGALVAAADVFCLPSRYEAFGLAAAEAMALGKPVVAAAAGGPQELVQHERTGLLAEPGSGSFGLGRALIRWVQQTDRAAGWGAAAAAFAQRELDIVRVADLVRRDLVRGQRYAMATANTAAAGIELT